MKKFSKLFWVALVVAAVLACTALGVFAAEVETTSTAVVYGETVKAADSFSVDFNFKNNNTKVECGKITLTWDSNKMTATSIDVAADGALSGAQFGSKYEAGKAVIAWAGSDISAAEGKLFTVNFANKGIAEDGYATVNVTVDNFGYTEGFTAKELKNDVKQSGAVVTGEEFDGLEFNAGDDPIATLNTAVELANEGQNVTLTLNANMLINSTNSGKDRFFYVEPGEGLAENAGTVTVVSGTITDGVPAYGIDIDSLSILHVKGNISFNNVNVSSHYAEGKTSRTYTTGGCFEFVEGLGTFGHDDTETENDFGVVGLATNGLKPHLSGHVEVYAGNYFTISGSYHGSPVKVETPSLVVGGAVKAEYLIGGAHNGGATNAIVGKTSVTLKDSAAVNYVSGGSWYNSGYENEGGTITIQDNANVKEYVTVSGAGSFKIKNSDDAVFVLNVIGGTVNRISGHVFNELYATATTNVEINVSGGNVTGGIFGGGVINPSEQSNSTRDYNAKTDKVSIKGKSKITLSTIISSTVYGGSYFKGANNVHDMDTTLIIDDGGVYRTDKQTAYIYAGSLFSGTYKWKYTKGTDDKTDDKVTTVANDNNKHLGTINLVLKNGAISKLYTYTSTNTDGSTKTNYVAGSIWGGSCFYSASNSIHDTTTTITAYVDEGNAAEYSVKPQGGMYFGSNFVQSPSNCEHKGTVTANISDAQFTVSTSSYVGVSFGGFMSGTNCVYSAETTVSLKNSSSNKGIVGGSYIQSATSNHKGNTTATLEGVTHTATSDTIVMGGSLLATAGAEHSGNSELIIKYNFSTATDNLIGGSYARNITTTGDDKGGHTGTSTLTIIGADPTGTDTTEKNNKTYSDLISLKSYAIAGSWLKSDGNIQTGASYLNLYNLFNHSSYTAAGKYNYKFTNTDKGLFFGGSFMNTSEAGGKAATHSGNSQVFVRSFTTIYGVYGGSWIDGYSTQSGTSKVIWDSYTAVDENLKETAAKGWAISYSASSTNYKAQVFGGSYISGWIGGNTTGGFNTVGNQTGDSFIEVYGRANGSTGDQRDRATIRYMFGGSYYSSNNTNQQVSNSTVTLCKGTLNYGSNIYGGSYYGCKIGNVQPKVTPTSKVEFTGDATFNNYVYGGSFFNATANEGVLYCNNVIIVNTTAKGLRADLYAGSSCNTTTTITVKGDALIELGPTTNFGSYASGSSSYYPSVKLNSYEGSKIVRDSSYESRIKFVGGLPANFTTKIEGMANFDVLDLYRSTITNPATIKDKSGKALVYKEVIYPFENGTAIQLDDINANGSTIMVPGDTLVDKIPENITIGSNTYNYADIIAFDKYAEYDNAFTIHDGTTDEQITLVQGTTRTIKLGVGDKRSAVAASFKNYLSVRGRAMLLDSGINYLVNCAPDIEEYFTNVYVKVVFDDNDESYDLSLYSKDESYSKFKLGLNPKSMARTFTATVYGTRNGVEYASASRTGLSAYEYCNTQWNSTNTALKALLVAMFEYADQDVLYNAPDTPTEELPSYKAKLHVSETEGGLTRRELYAVELRENITDIVNNKFTVHENTTSGFPEVGLVLASQVNVKFTIAFKNGGAMNDNLYIKLERFEANGETPAQTIIVDQSSFKYNSIGNDRYTVEVDKITTKQLGDKVLATIYEGNTPVSNTFCFNIDSLLTRKYGQAEENIAKALIKYGDAVKAYNVSIGSN